VGRLIDWKGVKYLVEAMKVVAEKLPKTKLLIIGTGPEKINIQNLIQELALNNNIILLGEIKNTEIKNYYSIADIFIIPSIVVNGHTEGLGVVTIEAMACGTPAIGTNVGGIPDVIKDGYNGFLVPPKSSDALATKIIEILSNQELQEFFTKNGIRTVKEKFSWVTVSDKFVNLFKSNI
jgi:glycosyltransferase involved in cell wall biosynthesis